MASDRGDALAAPTVWASFGALYPIAFNGGLIRRQVAITHKEILARLRMACNVRWFVCCVLVALGEHVRAACAAGVVQFPGCAWAPVR